MCEAGSKSQDAGAAKGTDRPRRALGVRRAARGAIADSTDSAEDVVGSSGVLRLDSLLGMTEWRRRAV